jgi:beta-galactosidase
MKKPKIPVVLTTLLLLQPIPFLPNVKAATINSTIQNTDTSSADRIVQNIDGNWTFHKGSGDFSSVDFNDSGWDKISLPHTWNAVDGSDGGNNYYRGDGWYRKTINVPESDKGKALYLQFGGANQEAEVFVNGKSVYKHTGGYSAFTVDITDFANYGQDNVIAVRVNNNVNDMMPLAGDFTDDGGLYRDVNLLVTDRTHIDVQDYSSSGVYVSYPNDESIRKQAQISIKVPVKVGQADLDSESNDVRVKAVLKDANGKSVESSELKVDGNTLKAADAQNGSFMFTGNMQVAHPHLWNGTKDPYLYTVDVTVSRKGQTIDQVNQTVGFRYFSSDPNKGFFLNGVSYPLRGVDVHQGDQKGYGIAVPNNIRAKDFDMIKEIGANAVRFAHYEHSQYDYDMADKLGLVVWAELPFVSKMSATTNFANNAEQQLAELIKQNYDHPSIVNWNLQNEVNSIQGSTQSQDQQYAQMTQLMQRLSAEAKELDPERLVSQAIMGQGPVVDQQLAWGSGNAGKLIDVSGVNEYYGWYAPNVADLAGALTQFHQKYPDEVLAISEYGAGANPLQHQLIGPNFTWNGFANARGQWHPEEYQNYVHEASYQIINNHPELWATFVWNMFDFASDGRNEGDHPGINDKGLVTYDRQIKKDAFYFYKAQWNQNDPFVYITSRRYTERAESVTPVKVYSNLDEVTLTVNGKDYGKGKLQQKGVFVWDNVELKASDNVVVATGEKSDGSAVTDKVTSWTVSPLNTQQ